MEWYIKLFRKIESWEWYTDTPTKCLFLHLLIRANIKDWKFRGMEIKKWTLVTGRKKLADETWLTEQQIRTSLDKLKSTNEITIKSTNSFSVIQIQNWDSYQDQSTNKAPNEQPTDNQRITTGEEGNKKKKERNNTYTESFEIFWKEYPNRVGKPDAMKKYKEQEHSEIMDWLERWKEYWDYSETEPRFIPHPATWLNQERWKDEPPETKPKTLSFTSKS